MSRNPYGMRLATSYNEMSSLRLLIGLGTYIVNYGHVAL